jgi:hypothetical protein
LNNIIKTRVAGAARSRVIFLAEAGAGAASKYIELLYALYCTDYGNGKETEPELHQFAFPSRSRIRNCIKMMQLRSSFRRIELS